MGCDYNIHIEVDENYDEIIITKRGSKDISSESWMDWENEKQYIGKPINFNWVCTNNNGYKDMVSFAVGEYFPNVIIISIASQLEIKTL